MTTKTILVILSLLFVSFIIWSYPSKQPIYYGEVSLKYYTPKTDTNPAKYVIEIRDASNYYKNRFYVSEDFYKKTKKGELVDMINHKDFLIGG